MLNDPNHSYRDYVSAAYTGHYHSQGFLPENGDPNLVELLVRGYQFDPNDYDPNGPLQLIPPPGYDLYIVDDTHIDPSGNLDDIISLQLVTVTEGETGFTYDSRQIIVPEPSTVGLVLVGEVIRRCRRRRWPR